MANEKEISRANDSNKSCIREFFRNQNVFLTGASGFLGKVIMEKLLRTTDVKMIYILIRKKRNKNSKERVADVFADPLFQVLRKEKPDFLERIHLIVGDCSLPYLDLTKDDNQLLKENVSIVIHSAATVRFVEPLKTALDINVRATLALIELSKEMNNIKSFVHVSTAFANCDRQHIDEMFYKDGISGENACLLADLLGPELLEKISSNLVGDFPNTYAYTKGLAEKAILNNSKDLPICVLRPGIVFPAYTEPFPGWTDNINGPLSCLYGSAKGIVRVFYTNSSHNAPVVPVDYCANAILACSWYTAMNHSAIPIIYNYIPDPENLVDWEVYRKLTVKNSKMMPLNTMQWYPTLTLASYKTWYKILCIFYHFIPALIVDFGLIVLGRKRRMLKMYKHIYKSSSIFSYFAEKNWHWTFTCNNIQKIWTELPESDRKIYPFDMKQIDWNRHLYNTISGLRRYIAKEEPTTIPQGIKLVRRLRILHFAVLLTVYSFGICLLLLWCT